jgi:hypothetical protein
MGKLILMGRELNIPFLPAPAGVWITPTHDGDLIMRKPNRPNIAGNVLEDDDTANVAPRNSSSKRRAAAVPAKNNSRTTAKPRNAKPTGKGKSTQRNSSQRDTNNSRDRNKDRGAKNFEGVDLTFEFSRETKNKLVYVELDDDGDMVKEFGGGVLGSPIYYPKDLGGRKPPQQIRVIIEEA